MKYLKLFEEESNYQTFVNNGEMVLPNVSYIEESDRCAFNPAPKVILNYNCPNDNSLAFSTGIDQIKKLTINGENIDLTQIQAPYYFEAAGEYTVEVELLNNSFARMFTDDGNTSLTSVIINRGVTMIGAYAFKGCTKLESVYIPNSVTMIDVYTFQGCSSLKSITIPNSVTAIGTYAFCDCISLESITIPNSVAFIGPCAFQGCTSLKSITIPDSVMNIGVGAFYGCSSLTSITLPDSVTMIGNNAFAGCSSLASITCKATVAPNIFSATFQGVKMGGSLHYPAGSDYSSWLSNSGYYLGYYNWNKLMIVAKYNVTSTTAATTICGNTSYFSLIIVDGTRITPATTYTFTTTGEHEVVFVLNSSMLVINVFQNCSALTSINIPDGVENIPNYAFNGCSSLTSITIPNSVVSIGNNAFYSCSKLASITIPDSITSMGVFAFYGCSSLTSITIPNSVVSIGNNAFNGCTSLASITIPDSVTSMGNAVFNGCTSLASITIPDSVTYIGSEVFYGCTSLTSITIPNSVTSIRESAFYGCSKLSSITCNATVAPTITNTTFQGIKQYGSLYYPAGSNYSSWLSTSSYYLGYYKWNKAIVAKYNVTSTTANTTICYKSSSFSQIFVDGKQITPSTTGGAAYHTFPTTGENEVVYVLSGNTIGATAFRYCSLMTSITIPNGVTSIGGSAFQNCSSLASIYIPDSVTSIGTTAFQSCSKIESITIPDSVTSIGANAFSGCTSLISLYIPNKVTSIENGIFQGCTKLASITIPDSVTSIGTNAFAGCSSLTSITIPSSVTSMGNNVFNSCSKLASITCNATVAPTISSTTFQAIKQCGSLYYPAGSNYSSWLSNSSYYLGYYNWNKAIVAKYNITNTTGNSTICYNTSSFSKIIVDGTAITLSTAGYKFTTTGEHEIVYVLNGTTIGDSAFRYCSQMTSIDIPNGVTTIGNTAFATCSSLTSITIPNSVTSIGTDAFDGCSKLVSITCNATVAPTITNTTFYNIKQYGTLHYPEGSDYSLWLGNSGYYLGYYKWNKAIVAKYNVTSTTTATKICNNTTSFSQMIVDGTSKTLATTNRFNTTGEHEVVYVLNGTTIGDSAFRDCSLLTSITLPANITTIGGGAFYGCTSLASITIPNGVTSIGASTFNRCSSLASITIPDSVTSIGNHAFYSCSKLASITIPNNVTTIGTEAFRSCNSLTSITIPNSITYIANSTFSGCTKLASITCLATVAPTIYTNTFYNVKKYGTLCVLIGSDYSSWLRTNSYYLGYYKWNLRYI